MGIDNSDETVKHLTQRAQNGDFDAALHIGDLVSRDIGFFYFKKNS